MLRNIKIRKLRITLVLRHRFEKRNRLDPTFRRWEVSIWFRKSLIVGRNNFCNPKEWGKNLVNSYMIGFEFLIFKAWINWDLNGKHIVLPSLPTK